MTTPGDSLIFGKSRREEGWSETRGGMSAWSARPHSTLLLITALIPATGFHSCAVSHAFCSLTAKSPGVRCLLSAPSEAAARLAAPRGAFARCGVGRGMLKVAAGAQPVRHSSWARRCSSDESGGAGGAAWDDSRGQGGSPGGSQGGSQVESQVGSQGLSELTHEERVAIYWIEECAPHAGVCCAPLLGWIL